MGLHLSAVFFLRFTSVPVPLLPDMEDVRIVLNLFLKFRNFDENREKLSQIIRKTE